jgi:hypothetical protein
VNASLDLLQGDDTRRDLQQVNYYSSTCVIAAQKNENISEILGRVLSPRNHCILR